MTTAIEDLWLAREGATLHATLSGTGRPVVLLHGALASQQAARASAGALDQRFRVITPDLRGSGRSHFGGPLSWDLLADDVAAVLDHLELPRATIGGTSFGAGVAVRLALRHPDRLSALLVLNPAFAGAEVGFTPAQRAAMDAMDAAGSRVVAEGIEVLFPLFEALPPEMRARARAVVATYDPASVATTTRFAATGPQPFALAELATITAPTLVVPGADPTHPAELGALYQRHIPHAAVRTAAPDQYAAVIAAFLDERR